MPRGRRFAAAPEKPYLPYEPDMLGAADNGVEIEAPEPIELLHQLVQAVDSGLIEPPGDPEFMVNVRKAILKDRLKPPPVKEVARNGDWKPVFLEELARRANVSAAARKAGVSYQLVYQTYHRQISFAKAMDEAKHVAVDRLKERAWQRAEYDSDTLMKFLLQAHDPETFGSTIRRSEQQPAQTAEPGPQIMPVEDYRHSVAALAPPAIEGEFSEIPRTPVPANALADLAEREG